MRSKSSEKPKDHKKIKHKVGVRKVARNETNAQSVSSKRIVIPVQTFGPSSDVISDSLIGLRHFNNKKRIDAINALNRMSPSDFGRDKLVSVLVCASYALSDDDPNVRQKCTQLIVRLLSEPDISSIGSISAGVGIHIRSSLSSVNAAVRRDTMLLLEKLLNVAEDIFDEPQLNDLLSTLLQLGTTIVLNQQYTSEEDRSVVKRVLQGLFERLHAIRKSLQLGQVRSSQWCVSAILSVGSNSSTLSVDVSRYLTGLKLSGDLVEFESLLSLTRQLGISLVDSVMHAPLRGAVKRAKSSSSGGGVFSKMARMMHQEDSDS